MTQPMHRGWAIANQRKGLNHAIPDKILTFQNGTECVAVYLETQSYKVYLTIIKHEKWQT